TIYLFFGGWGSFYFIKLSFMLILFCWIRATLPRYRWDQLMILTWRIFLPFTLCAVALLFFVINFYTGFDSYVIIDSDLELRFRLLFEIYGDGSEKQYQELLALYELLLRQRGLL
ncbi:hypothetical protein EON71_01145, partial [bacterium]